MPVEDIASLLVGRVSPWAVIVFIIWFGYRQVRNGDYIPKSTVDLLLSQSDKIIATYEKTIESQEKQIAALHDSAQTTKHALESLQEAGVRQSGSASTPTSSREGP